MNKFDLIYENIMNTIQNSFVDYKLTSDWIKEVEKNMKNMTKEQAIEYSKSLDKYTYNDLGKKEALDELMKTLF